MRDGGLWLIGRKALAADGGSDFPMRLSPAFELSCQVQPQPGGRGVVLTYVAQPLLLITSIDSWTLSSTHNAWPLKGMACESQLREAVKRGEAMVQQMRAQQAGLVVASEMPKARMQ